MWRMKALVAFLAIGLAASLTAATPAAPTADLTGKLHWRSLGPLIGGRSVAVTGVPSNPNLFYFGGVDGGVWRSTNYGVSWENISDGKICGAQSIGAIAVSLSNPKVIYAGTGEPDIRGDFITGDGIWKSTDAGNTWKYAGLTDTHTISKIVIDPKDPNTVYAASLGHVFAPNSERGVFKTTDGGKTWNKILFVDNNTGAVDLVMDPQNRSVLYASMWQANRKPWAMTSGGPGSGLYKSVDGGAHWTNLSRTPGFPTGTLGKMGVSVSASHPNIVYVIAQAKDGGIFRSEDGGKSWKRVNSSPELRQRAFYYMAIFVDPKDPNVVYVPNVQAVWISRNGGKSFTQSDPPHGDNHIVWINPNNTKILLVGDDGGAQVSTDGGKTYSTFLNQPTGQFYRIAIDDAFPFNVYGAQQDDGSSEGPSNGGSGIFEWNNVADGESTFVAPEPGNTSITYGSGYVSRFVRFDKDTGEDVSVAPWPEYKDGSASNEQADRFGWTHPIAFSPADSKTLFTAAQFVFKSDDHGKTWTKISPDLTRNDPKTEGPSGGPVDLDQTGVEIFPDINALGLSPLDVNEIWSGSQDGLVHVTTDGGANWKDVTPPDLPQWSEITSIEPSYTDKGTAYVSAWRYQYDDVRPFIYKTTDYGAHWTKATTGLPNDQYVFVVRIDPKNANLIFAGTKDTVYVSYDAGAHWQSLASNLPSVQVRDIAIDTREGEVAIATHGRAFWALDNLKFLEQLTESQEAGLRLFAPQGAWLTHAYTSDGSGNLKTSTAGESPIFGATVFFNIPSDYKGKTPATLTFLDSKGAVVRTLTLHAKDKKKKKDPEATEVYRPTQDQIDAQHKATAIEPGMNRYVWDLRYEGATRIAGYNPPGASAFLDTVAGPSVVPGTYTVVLNYGGKTQQQTFTVTLDPRLKATADDLDARLTLSTKIRDTLDALNRSTNDALAARAKATGAARAALDAQIADVVDLKIQSLEGDILHESRLSDYLAFLGSEVDLSYTKPTAAEYAVFDKLSAQAQDAEGKLKAAIARLQRP